MHGAQLVNLDRDGALDIVVASDPPPSLLAVFRGIPLGLTLPSSIAKDLTPPKKCNSATSAAADRSNGQELDFARPSQRSQRAAEGERQE
jgi:hypothetical protein